MVKDKFLVEVIGDQDNSMYNESIQIDEETILLKSVEELDESELFGADLEDFLAIQKEIEKEKSIKRDLCMKIRKLEIDKRKKTLTEEKLKELKELKKGNDILREQIVLYDDNI